MKSKTYVRVAVLFLVTVIIAFWGLNYLKGKNLLSTERSFYAFYDRIGGLTKSSPVTINGFQIGQVRKIDLDRDQPERIEVRFSISYRNVQIPVGSTARIYSVDLMGTKGIALDLSDNLVMCARNDTLRGAIEGDLRDQVNTQMLPLKLKIESLMSSMDSVLSGIQLVFNEENRTNLSESFTSVNRTLNNLESASRFLNEYVVSESKRVTSLLGSVDTLGRDLMNRSADIRGIISNMNRFSDTLANLQVSEVVTTLKRVLIQIDLISSNLSAGQGSLGRLLEDDSLYQALLATNGAVNRLIEDIRINPGKYVHVGIVNKTRPIYAVNDSGLAKVLGGEGTSPYYVCIFHTAALPGSRQSLPEGIQEDRFIQIGQELYYYQFKSSRIEPCIRRITKARLEFPSAGIFTWVNGQWMRLDI